MSTLKERLFLLTGSAELPTSASSTGKDNLDDTGHLKSWGFSGKRCHCCGKMNSEIQGLLMQCAKCKKVYYCSVKCFNEDLPTHQKACQSGELDRAPKLTKAQPMTRVKKRKEAEKVTSEESKVLNNTPTTPIASNSKKVKKKSPKKKTEKEKGLSPKNKTPKKSPGKKKSLKKTKDKSDSEKKQATLSEVPFLEEPAVSKGSEKEKGLSPKNKTPKKSPGKKKTKSQKKLKDKSTSEKTQAALSEVPFLEEPALKEPLSPVELDDTSKPQELDRESEETTREISQENDTTGTTANEETKLSAGKTLSEVYSLQDNAASTGCSPQQSVEDNEGSPEQQPSTGDEDVVSKKEVDIAEEAEIVVSDDETIEEVVIEYIDVVEKRRKGAKRRDDIIASDDESTIVEYLFEYDPAEYGKDPKKRLNDIVSSLLVMIATRTPSPDSGANQKEVLSSLKANEISFDIVDANDPDSEGAMKVLLQLSGHQREFPQFFVKMNDGTITFWGGWEKFKKAKKDGRLKDEFESASAMDEITVPTLGIDQHDLEDYESLFGDLEVNAATNDVDGFNESADLTFEELIGERDNLLDKEERKVSTTETSLESVDKVTGRTLKVEKGNVPDVDEFERETVELRETEIVKREHTPVKPDWGTLRPTPANDTIVSPGNNSGYGMASLQDSYSSMSLDLPRDSNQHSDPNLEGKELGRHTTELSPNNRVSCEASPKKLSPCQRTLGRSFGGLPVSPTLEPEDVDLRHVEVQKGQIQASKPSWAVSPPLRRKTNRSVSEMISPSSKPSWVLNSPLRKTGRTLSGNLARDLSKVKESVARTPQWVIHSPLRKKKSRDLGGSASSGLSLFSPEQSSSSLSLSASSGLSLSASSGLSLSASSGSLSLAYSDGS